MNTVSYNPKYLSPFNSLTDIFSIYLDKITKKKINAASKDIQKIIENQIEFLEKLNSVKNYIPLEGIEELSVKINFINKLLIMVLEMSANFKVDDVSVGNEFIHLNNQIGELSSVLKKILVKLGELQNSYLTEQHELLSSEVLDSVWEGEEDVWDKFYKESIQN